MLNYSFWFLKCVLILCSCLEMKDLSWNSNWDPLEEIQQKSHRLETCLSEARGALKQGREASFCKCALK